MKKQQKLIGKLTKTNKPARITGQQTNTNQRNIKNFLIMITSI